jgi:glycosyltransferase involved in cell wall biosynthesis
MMEEVNCFGHSLGASGPSKAYRREPNGLGQPTVSIVLAVKNGIRTIEQCLDCATAQTHPAELIVIDNFSTDGTAEICRGRADRFHQMGPERSAQRNFGIRESSAEYILILDADQYLSPDVVRECIEIAENRGMHAVFIPEETIAQGFWGKCIKFERDFYLIGDKTAEAARFFSRAAILEVGGYDEEKSGGEDWDLSDRLLARYPLCGRTRATLTHDEGRVNLVQWIRKKGYYFRTGASQYAKTGPAHRRAFYLARPSVRKQWHRFLRHPLLGLGSILIKCLEGLALVVSVWWPCR